MLVLLSILCILCFCIVWCVVSAHVFNCLISICAQVYWPQPPSGNPTAVPGHHTALRHRHFLHGLSSKHYTFRTLCVRLLTFTREIHSSPLRWLVALHARTCTEARMHALHCEVARWHSWPFWLWREFTSKRVNKSVRKWQLCGRDFITTVWSKFCATSQKTPCSHNHSTVQSSDKVTKLIWR